jgi:hypothetical protein
MILLNIRPAKSKESTPKDVALIDARGVLKYHCRNQQFSGVMEYWKIAVMPFFCKHRTQKNKKMFSSYSLYQGSTLQYSIAPILQGVSISGRADKL